MCPPFILLLAPLSSLDKADRLHNDRTVVIYLRRDHKFWSLKNTFKMPVSSEISDFTPSTQAQSNTLHTRYVDKTDY